MIATQGSTARDTFARTLESARRKLRDTIERYPDTLPGGDRSERGAFPGMLWSVASLLGAEHDSEADWWREQAIRYAKMLAAFKDDSEPAGLGATFLPAREAVGDEAIVHVGRRLLVHLKADEHSPTIESLIDAVLVFEAAAISGESDMQDTANAHCLAARRLLVRGDGSVAGTTGSTRDLAWAIYGFSVAYRFTRDGRFLGTADNCAAYLLENLDSDNTADAIAAAAMLQLSSLTADLAKSRLYALFARQFLTILGEEPLNEGLGGYFFLDTVIRSTPGPSMQLAPRNGGSLNGTVHSAGVATPEAPPAQSIEPETVAQAEPEPEELGRRLLRPWMFLLAPIVFFLLIEILVFRSNYYLRFVEPESAAGTFEGVIDHEWTRPRHDKEIIILGSSRIAEGFSTKRVNEGLKKDDLWFVNGAVPGAGPRCMYYFVRDVDPHRDRYKAIVMTIDDYDDHDDLEDFSDRTADVYEVIARLRFTDILPFTRSFSSRQAQWEVFKASLIKSSVYQRDVQEFLDHPGDRMDKVKLFREHRFGWAEDYLGATNSLAGTTVDWTTRKVTFPPNIPKSDQDYLGPRLVPYGPQTGKTRAFQIRWLGAFADLYRNSKTLIIFIQPPRTPFPPPVPRANWKETTVDDLAKRPWVRIIDKHKFENLEKPELFADHVHLNNEGNKLFSPALADAVKEVLPK